MGEEKPLEKYTVNGFRLSGECVILNCTRKSLFGELLEEVSNRSQHLLPGASKADVQFVVGRSIHDVRSSECTLGQLGIGPETIVNIVLTDYLPDWAESLFEHTGFDYERD